MAELLLQQRYYIAAILLFSIGLVTLFLHPNLVKKIIGLNLMDTAVFLFLAAMGYVEGGKAPIVEQGAEQITLPLVPFPGFSRNEQQWNGDVSYLIYRETPWDVSFTFIPWSQWSGWDNQGET